MLCFHCLSIILGALCFLLADVTYAQQEPLRAPSEAAPILDADFDAFVEETLDDFRVPGMSIAVIDNGKIESKGYGYAILPDQNATADTQYFTGSTTKAFTAAALAQLIWSGKHAGLTWSSPIRQFLRSDFVLEDEYATSHTTIEDALSHRSGLPRHDLIYGQPNDTPSSIVQRMRYLPMTAEPRTLWQYCNLMFVVMTDLIETLTGKSLEFVLRENLWKPLGMSSTTFTIPEESERSRLARGYYWHAPDPWSPKKGEYIPDPYIDLLPISGAGATISTVNDYALWMQAWLDAANQLSTTSPIKYWMVSDLLTPRAIVQPDTGGMAVRKARTPPLYALGWVMMDIFGEKVVAHDGGLTGFGTTLYLLPNKNFGVVTMGNTMGTSNTAGAYIASKLFLEKILGKSWAETTTVSQFHEVLNILPKTRLGPTQLRYKSINLPSAFVDVSNSTHSASLDWFVGLYSHPAYGNINFTSTTSGDEVILEGGFYDRTWPLKIQLHRFGLTTFSVNLYWAHGLGDILSGEGIVWEEVGESWAVFEFDLSGAVMERLGIILEDEMMDQAMRKGESEWRDGMIWFERIDR